MFQGITSLQYKQRGIVAENLHIKSTQKRIIFIIFSSESFIISAFRKTKKVPPHAVNIYFSKVPETLSLSAYIDNSACFY